MAGRHTFALGCAAVFLLGALVRLLVLWQSRDMPLFDTLIVDSRAYDLWARRVAEGEWLRGRPFYQAPLYPYLLGIVYALVGSDAFWIRVGQCVLGGGASALMALACRPWLASRTALVAGVMMALYAPAVFFDGLIQKAALDSILVPLVLWALGSANARGGAARWLLAGAAMGVQALSRETMLLMALVIVPWVALGWRPEAGGAHGRRSGWIAAACMAAGVMLGVSPAHLHNVYHGAPLAVTTTNAGLSFYLGNGAPANGTYVPLREGRGDTRFEETDTVELAEQGAGRALSAQEVSAWWMGRALTDIGADPVRWLRLVARKAALTVNRIEMIDTDDIYLNEGYSVLLRALNSAWNFGLLLPLACVGLVLTVHRRRSLAPLYLAVAANALALVVFYVVARYRYPMALLLLPFAAAALTHLSRATLPRAAGAALAGLALAWLPVTDKNAQLSASYFNVANTLAEDGRHADAARFFEMTHETGRRDAPLFVNHAALLTATGRTDEAAALAREGLALHPRDARLQLAAANAALAGGRPAEAGRFASAAVVLDPSLAEAHNTLGAALIALGRPAEARAALERALELRPDYPLARRNLERTGTDDDGTTAASTR